MKKSDSEVRGEHVLEAIEFDWEQEAVGHATIGMWVMAAMCDGHQRFNPCKNVPHLNPNENIPCYSACHYARHMLFPHHPNLQMQYLSQFSI